MDSVRKGAMAGQGAFSAVLFGQAAEAERMRAARSLLFPVLFGNTARAYRYEKETTGPSFNRWFMGYE